MEIGARQLEAVFRDYFVVNRGAPCYGITAAYAIGDPSTINLRVTFMAGKTNCCVEPGCHFGRDWTRLRMLADQHGLTLPKPLTIRFHGIVEPDVKLTSLGKQGDGGTSEGYEYYEEFAEGA